MNCILYSCLVTKYNQISQNVDTTAHFPITLKVEQRGRMEKLTELMEGMSLQKMRQSDTGTDGDRRIFQHENVHQHGTDGENQGEISLEFA